MNYIEIDTRLVNLDLVKKISPITLDQLQITWADGAVEICNGSYLTLKDNIYLRQHK